MDQGIAFYIFDKNGIAVHWYGIIIAIGLLTGAVLGLREAKRRGYRTDMILDFLLIAIPLCIISARLYYVAFKWSDYASDPLSIFAVWQGGLAIYGAVIGGAIAAFIFYKWRKVPIGDILDIAAPSIIIGQAIGRWGNFVNQEAFGNAVTNTANQWFPLSVYIDRPVINGVLQSPGWYQATFFYESMWNLITFAVLMLLRKKIKIRGGVFALYLVMYGFGRFWIEQLRTDSLTMGDARVSQWLSAAFVVFGILYLIIMSRQKKEYAAYDGIYSLSWNDDKIKEYKLNTKKVKAKAEDSAKAKDKEEKEEAENKKTDTKEE